MADDMLTSSAATLTSGKDVVIRSRDTVGHYTRESVSRVWSIESRTMLATLATFVCLLMADSSWAQSTPGELDVSMFDEGSKVRVSHLLFH